MRKIESTNVYYGYCRASLLRQEDSPAQQESAIRSFITGANGTVGGIFSEHGSATSLSYRDRPVLRELLTQLSPGDHLVVWRLDRLERKALRMVALANELLDKGVFIHSLNEAGGMQIDLDTITGKMILMVMGIAAEMDAESRRDATQRGLRAAKEAGKTWTSRPSLGKKRITRVNRKGVSYKVDVWDNDQIAIVNEIVRRHDNGEPLTTIAEDFYKRKLRKPYGSKKNKRGVPWASKFRGGRINAEPVRRAYEKAKALEQAGTPLGIDPPKENENVANTEGSTVCVASERSGRR
jgi:DNA invertase Pin-like site-specific DNA recombinase